MKKKEILNFKKFDQINESNDELRDLYEVFLKSKEKHLDEVYNLINKVSKLEKDKYVQRYLNELNKYYKTLSYVPPNLMFDNIKRDTD
jgi:hypothetical protein